MWREILTAIKVDYRCMLRTQRQREIEIGGLNATNQCECQELTGDGTPRLRGFSQRCDGSGSSYARSPLVPPAFIAKLPPSIGMIAPVIHSDASEANNMASPLMS